MIFLDILSLDMFNDRLGLSMEFLMGNIICVPSRVSIAEALYDHDNFVNVKSFLKEINYHSDEEINNDISRT